MGHEKDSEAQHRGAMYPVDTHSTGDVAKVGAPRKRHTSTLNRTLKSRHVQFLALSSTIGTGLFLSSGQSLSLAGPLGVLISYGITGFNLFCTVNCLGEMAVWLPVPGGAPIFASRYVDPALGFTLGWNYWYRYAMGVAIEITACAVILEYWPNNFPKAAAITILLATAVIANFLPVRIYGETEFVFGVIKITAIVGIMVLMLVITAGGSPSGDVIGFRYWTHPGPMNEYLEEGPLGRFLAFWKVFIQATFTFGGGEMFIVAAGETENPRRNIPKALRRFIWRIVVFYIGSIFLVGLCISSKDERLLNAINSSAPGANQSPFVVAIGNAGIKLLPGIINGVILTSAWSSGNSFLYAAARVLYSAALEGTAPSIFRRERFGVPYVCVAVTAVLSCVVFLNVENRPAEVFFWIMNLSTVTGLLISASLAYSYLRFYHALRHHGINRDTLAYKAPMQPFSGYFSLTFNLVVTLFNGFDAFFPGRLSAKSFLPCYIGVPICLALFLGYKFIKKTKFITLEEMDLWSGKAEIDRLEGTWAVPEPRNFVERIWFWLA
ncbi:hypothetical protein NLG97_g3839 [Lecanicillium saksenae]|uniref:Uncharacterized protein n=1 Tax=Lecanicillium saksenae TaxID=468837 RepID=A0ACC1R0X1_9HYPO|nr:hypothetical protein NLG97_g3839 [Lecanicillium saksenae]